VAALQTGTGNPAVNTLAQERLLKICAVKFFREWEKSAEPEGEAQN
jgi:hypothetical protein